MGRELRVEYKGAIYHVIQRGNNKEFIFDKDVDKVYLINYVNDLKLDMGFRLFAYVLMSNHYHFILQTLDKPLHEIMHRINNKYSKYYNYNFNHTGHVFERRYKAIPVQDERYLLELVRYIHQNPVRAGICLYVGEYKWSSDWCYRFNNREVVDIDVVLGSLSRDREQAIDIYNSYVQYEETDDYDNIKSVGDEAYSILYGVRTKLDERKRLDEVLVDTGLSIEEFELIKKGSRERGLTQYKLMYIKQALKLKYTMKEVGQNINMSYSAVLNLLNRHK